MNNKLFSGQRKTIGLLCDNLSIGYTSLFWREIHHQCQEYDVNLILYPMNYSKHEGDLFRKSISSFINDYCIDGLIVLANTLLVTMTITELNQFISQIHNIPIISSGLILDHVNCNVTADQHSGLEEALEHLIVTMKKTKIAFLKGLPSHVHTIERFQVYCNMLEKYSLPYDETLVVDGDYFLESGAQAVDILYDKRKCRPEAIIACNDDMALGVIHALNERGLKTPQDILVIGYDNIPEIQGGRSSLATVYQPVSQLAQTAFLILCEILDGVNFPKQIQLSSYFIWRESAGQPTNDFKPTLTEKKGRQQSFDFKKLKEERIVQSLFVEGVHHFMNAQSIDELTRVMAQELPRVLIHSCFLCMYNKENSYEYNEDQINLLPIECSYLWGYCHWSHCQKDEHISFPTHQILPIPLSLPDHRLSMILEPLFMWNQAYGYLFYELNIESGSIYETIRRQLNSALQLIFLLKEEKKINTELQHTIEVLRNTENQLIESEKMAALGTLVAGVAHEINTPVGVSISATSYLTAEVFKTKQFIEGNQLTRNGLSSFIQNIEETCKILSVNLERAAGLVKSFKNIAVDQQSEEQRSFHIKEYLEQILLSLHPKIKKTLIAVLLNCDEDLVINSYPGALSQIITNLMMNALDHAFYPEEKGQIQIQIQKKEDFLEILFEDNGHGIEPNHLAHIFEPFFTTKRGQGGMGLGLHIVYNLVCHQLKGTIECQSILGSGSRFIISLPITLYHEEV
ncbi:MAG: substrate-binding domain-containing protein [Vallitaleaceae bacterium]|nr:substrate-binding domain-containing protein [Vallitaleaceae bacterium]